MNEALAQLVGGLFLVAGGGGYAWLWLHHQRVLRSRGWPCVPGTVLRSQVVRTTTAGGPGSPRAAIFEARIEYEYAVGSETLRGDTIGISGELNTSFRQRAEQRCLRYPVGAEVAVYYDPAEPGKACLERKGDGARLGRLISCAFCLIGLLSMAGLITWGR